MCHSNNVVIYRVVFGPERMTYSVKESYYWSYLQLTKVYNVQHYYCGTYIQLYLDLSVWHIQLRNHTNEAIYNWLKCIMCHSNNVVIYRVVFGPERITYSVKESYYWS